MKNITLICLIGLICLVAACNRGPKMVNISGTITIAGETFDKGIVQFDPVDKQGPSAGGKIENGKYSVSVPPGEKIVRIRGTKVVGQFEADPVLNPGVMTDKLQDVTDDKIHWGSDDTRVTAEKNGQVIDIDFPAK